MKRVISTPEAPGAVGPYSQAIEAAGTLYVSGQIPINPATGKMAEGVEAQAVQVLENVGAILRAAGYTFDDVVKTTVLLEDIADFGTVNAVYARYYTKDMPARACFQVAKLPMGAKVEIETVAVK